MWYIGLALDKKGVDTEGGRCRGLNMIGRSLSINYLKWMDSEGQGTGEIITLADQSIETASGNTQEAHRLERNVLAVPHGIALAAAAMAPAIAVVLNAPAAGPGAGAALPLSFLLSFFGCLFVGNTVFQICRR